MDTVFYKNTLGFKIGRDSEVENFTPITHHYTLGSHDLPVFHFGVILNLSEWIYLYQNLYNQGIEVIVEKEFFMNKVGEHISFFIKDPNGYNIEFKYFKNKSEVFKILKEG